MLGKLGDQAYPRTPVQCGIEVDPIVVLQIATVVAYRI